MTKRFTPAVFIAVFNVIAFAVMIGFHLATQIPIHFVNQWIVPGVDYRDFYQASVHVLNGESPYLDVRYVTPPLFALANIPLSLLGFGAAKFIFTLLIPFTILCSYLAVYRALKDSDMHDNEWLHLSGLLVILFSYPLYFLFERGNIDGVVLVCMCLGLYCMDKRPWLGGLLLAVAVHFKLYPILILFPLFLSRRKASFYWTIAWILVFVLLTAPYWNEYMLVLSKRSSSFQLFENGSLVNTMLFTSILLRGVFGEGGSAWGSVPTYAAILFGIFMFMLILADYKVSRTASPKQNMLNALLYFPFMVALPRSVYHYAFVILIPLLPVLDILWKDARSRSRRFTLGAVTLGIALSQWQAIALFDLTDNLLAYYIPGFGLLIAMTGISVYKWLQWKDALKQGALPLPQEGSPSKP